VDYFFQRCLDDHAGDGKPVPEVVADFSDVFAVEFTVLPI